MTVRSLPLVTPVAVGANGSATANVTGNLFGEILAVGVTYLGTPPAGTTDLVLVAVGAAIGGEGGAAPDQTILSIANAATDGWFYPRAVGVTPLGAAFTDDIAVLIPVSGPVKLTMNGADAGDQIAIVILYK